MKVAKKNSVYVGEKVCESSPKFEKRQNELSIGLKLAKPIILFYHKD